MGLLQRRARRPDDVERQLEQARRVEGRLRDEVGRVQRALDSLPIGVVLVDAEGAVRTRNAAATRLGGGVHAEVLVLEAIDKHVARALAGSDSRSVVELFGPPLRNVQVESTRLPGGGVLVTVEDISDRARLDAVRTDFVANVSHELKTPVGALAVLAEALGEEDDLEVVHRLAAKMVSEAHRAATAIDDLLELSRIELGGRAVREPVDVAQVMHESVERVSASSQQRSIKLTLVEPTGPVSVMGDRRQLVSALGNLVENAVKYSEADGPVKVSAEVIGDMVEFTVVDAGIGIPTRDLDRIFERFYRVDRARSRDTGGTGLGLAIVRHVATNHDGAVGVQSVEGEGSTFTLRIPVAS